MSFSWIIPEPSLKVCLELNKNDINELSEMIHIRKYIHLGSLKTKFEKEASGSFLTAEYLGL